MRFTKILSAALLALGLGAQAQAEEPGKLVTILSAPEPQTQLMAMVLTMNAMAAGAEAEVLLCGPAGDMGLKDAPEGVTTGLPPKNVSPQGLMTMLMEKQGLKVQVCAIYLPGLGADASVLMDGVGVAKPDTMAASIMAPGTTVMSF